MNFYDRWPVKMLNMIKISIFDLLWGDIWNISYVELRIWNQVSYDHRTGVARSRDQTPLKSWLFQPSIRNCLNCVQVCDDHSLLNLINYWQNHNITAVNSLLKILIYVTYQLHFSLTIWAAGFLRVFKNSRKPPASFESSTANQYKIMVEM